MNLSKETIPILLSALLASTAFATEPVTIKILKTGNFHADEVPKTLENNWFALVVSKEQAELKAVSPTITTVYDPVLDDEKNQATYSGKQVAVSGEEPLLLITMQGMRPGKVIQADVSDLNTDQRIVFLNTEYLLQHKCKEEQSEDGLRQCVVSLVGNGIEQWIADAPEGESDYAVSFRTVWAGDLDRDGKLDMVVEESTYNYTGLILYLSSPAKKDAHVISVARLSQTGC